MDLEPRPLRRDERLRPRAATDRAPSTNEGSTPRCGAPATGSMPSTNRRLQHLTKRKRSARSPRLYFSAPLTHSRPSEGPNGPETGPFRRGASALCVEAAREQAHHRTLDERTRRFEAEMTIDNPRPNGDHNGTAFGNRASDRSALTRLANNAVVTLASRAAFLVVLGVVTWMSGRFINTLDDVAKDAAELSKNVAVISATVNGHERRIEKIEAKVFR
jgi:hypothetical protein